jgi:VWFA-related protein
MRHLSAVVAGSVVLALAIALPHAQSSARPSERRARQVYVSVLDRDNKPVPDLGAADFVVREDNVAREVLSATPATEPLTIAVTVDDSQAATYAIQFIRDGLTNFVKRLDGKAEIALSTVGERPTPLVEYTTSTAQLQKGIGRLFARPGSGAYLLEALVELSHGLEKRSAKEGDPAPRRAIVVLTVENGPEFSNLYYERVLDALKKSGAALHVLAIGNPAPSDTDEMKNRNMVIAEGTSLTGGRRDQILAESGISDRLLQLADELTNQYLVSYSRPETLIPPEKLDVSVSKPGLTVRAPKRVAAAR